MARNKQNLKQQLITRLENQRAYGQKKEKEQRGVENYNSGRAVRGIHSYASMRTYKSSVATYADWMKTAHPEIRSINDITESHVREYIEHRAETCSNFTLSKDLSAINRSLFGCTDNRDFYKLSDFGDYRRRTEDITNNRGIHTEHHTNHYARNEAQILAQAFGFRRSSLEAGKLTTDNLVWRDGHIIGCWTTEKNGKTFCAYCLYDYRDTIEKYVAERVERLGEGCALSDGIDSNCAVHQYRATFVKDVVRELAYDWSPLHQYRELFIDERKLERALSHPYYQNYAGAHNLEHIGIASQLISHNRLSIIFQHYWR